MPSRCSRRRARASSAACSDKNRRRVGSRDVGAAEVRLEGLSEWYKRQTVDLSEARSSSGSLISPQKTVGKRGPWIFATAGRGTRRRLRGPGWSWRRSPALVCPWSRAGSHAFAGVGLMALLLPEFHRYDAQQSAG